MVIWLAVTVAWADRQRLPSLFTGGGPCLPVIKKQVMKLTPLSASVSAPLCRPLTVDEAFSPMP